LSYLDDLKKIEKLEKKSIHSRDFLKKLTSILSDDTYLQNLQFNGEKVTISGQTSNASALMQSLGQIEGIKDVKAPVPSSRAPGISKDTFVIEFNLVNK
jgi:general secretion pathway protein L